MITIGKENSVTFAPVEYTTGQYNKLQSFDTRLVQDEYHRGWITQNAEVYFLKGEQIYCQIMTLSTDPLTVEVENGNTFSDPNPLSSHDGYFIWEFYVTLVNDGFTRITVFTESEKSVSECIEVIDLEELEAASRGYLKLQWYSYVNTVSFNYEIDVVNHCWVKGSMRQYQPKMNIEVFNNDEETLNLKTVYRRGQLAEIGSISRQAAEKIIIASQSDMFLVNHDRFVAEEEPEVVMISNLVDLSIPLIQSTVKGLNTHDVGYDIAHEETMTLAYEINEGDFVTPYLPNLYGQYLLHTIRIKIVEGTDFTIKCGTSLDDQNVIYPAGPYDEGWTPPFVVHRGVAELLNGADGSLYFTVTGDDLLYNIYIDLLNIEP